MFDPLDLGWLPQPPADFRQAVRAVQAGDGAVLQRLAGHRLDSLQSGMFNRALARVRAGGNPAPLSPFRLTLLSNATVDLIADALPVAAARHGVALEVTVAPYDQVLQEALNPASELHASRADAILLLLDHRWYGLGSPDPGNTERVSGAVDRLTAVLDGIQSVNAVPVILQTVAAPFLPLFGSYDRIVPGSTRDLDALNAAIVELKRTRGCYLLDADAICDIVGSARFHDPVAWNLYKLPMSREAVPFYADWVGRLLGAIQGKARKCLVLDLDNTLWGGVIGDDGIEGVRLGQGSAEGEAFLAVQRLALDLKRRGVILAVSSKNDDAVARSAFRDHPEMLLKESDVAVFQANWQDKASNIEAIARALEIGVDSLVLLDDNAAERAYVRTVLPIVAVPELGADPADYPAILAAAGYFEAVSFSEEDRSRSASYAANAQRAEVKARAHDLGDYLASLQMTICHAPFDSINRGRITQLINKTNQFNLTTRRRTEPAIAEIEGDAAKIAIYTRLADRFGDFGIIGVIIGCTDGDVLDIDTWLMSCRVLGRKVEEGMLEALLTRARQAGIAKVTATYIPTAKNGMVAEHFDKLGFARVEERQDGHVRYSLDVASCEAKSLPFQTA